MTTSTPDQQPSENGRPSASSARSSSSAAELRADLMADLAGPRALPGQEALPGPTAPPEPQQPQVPGLHVSLTPTRWKRPRRTADGLQVGPVSLRLSRS